MTRPSYVYACPCGYETTNGSNARRHAKTTTCVHDTMTKTRTTGTTAGATAGATTVYACPCGYETTNGSNARRHAKTVCVHDTMTKERIAVAVRVVRTKTARAPDPPAEPPSADDMLWTYRMYALGLGFGGQTSPVPSMPSGYGVRV